jgi:ribosomal protein S18 acetylase RimI-like enzyme
MLRAMDCDSLPFSVRTGCPEEDALIAEHFRQMWRDNGIPEAQICRAWEENVLRFVSSARQGLQYRSFVAELGAGQVVGSASCQLFAGLYPNILEARQRQYGYIWGVYVVPEQRRRGLATALTAAALDYLRGIGCTHALLHASPSGRPVYTGLGFQPTNELRLDLSELQPPS